MADSSENSNQTQLMSIEQIEQMFNMFQKLHKQPTNTSSTSQTVKIAEKLHYHNYTKWCKLMQISIGGRGRLSHITANSPPTIDPEYAQWSQKDSMVIPWIIENIDIDLANQFLEYTTSRDLWRGIETLLCSGRDELQIFYLSLKASTLTQGKITIEHFYGQLNTLCKEIDRGIPNPMKCSEDITMFNTYI